jgi:hypothetical protein
MKRKVKRFQEGGGVLRDRYGNPVRSGSGEVVRTTFPERSYNEQASSSMTESSDYSGRRPRTAAYSDDGMDVPHSSTPSMDDSEGPSLTERLRKASPGSKISEMDGEGGYTSPVKKKAIKTAKSAAKPSFDKAKTKTEAKPTPRYQDVVNSSELGSQSFSSKTKDEPPKKRGGIGPYGAFEGLTNYLSTLREGRKRPGEMKKGGSVKGYSSGGSTSSASKRADGIAKRGKTRGKVI